MDYKNSKIYKLQHNSGSFYIGSTCSELRKRLCNHKAKSKIYPNNKKYKFINGEWDKVKIILIEAFECSNKDELRKKEDEYIRKEMNNLFCLNSRGEISSPEILKQQKLKASIKYYEKNKDEINKKRRVQK